MSEHLESFEIFGCISDILDYLEPFDTFEYYMEFHGTFKDHLDSFRTFGTNHFVPFGLII